MADDATVRSLHDRAMELAMEAVVERHEGNDGRYKSLCEEAYQFERQAADLLPRESAGISRGILYRSAAWLAHNAGRYQEAFDTAQEGVAGQPQAWLMAELAEVINAAWDALESEKRWREAKGNP